MSRGGGARKVRQSLASKILGGPGSVGSLSRLFVGRSDLIRLFFTRLQEEPNTPQVLFFYGEGGNGKSWLLRYLRDNFCKVLHAYHYGKIKGLSDREFAGEVVKAQGEAKVPWAELDFADPVWGEDARNPLGALMILRRGLAKGLHFPVFDFAFVCYLQKAGRLTKERVASSFPAEAVGFVSAVASAFGSLGSLEPAVVVLKYVTNVLGRQFEVWKRTWHVDRAYLEAIQGLDQRELGRRLPQLLALDLLASMAVEDAPRRVVLLIDAHERLWGSDPQQGAFQVSERDEWLRRFLKTLLSPEGRRVIVVVAGRRQPCWEAATGDYGLAPEAVLAQGVQNLCIDDAREYLNRCGIVDGSLQDAICALTQVTKGEVHPLYLSLCADTVTLAATEDRTIKADQLRTQADVARRGGEVLGWLLSEVGVRLRAAVVTLSASRWFDYDIYVALGKELGFQHDRPSFRFLISSFSFIWRAPEQAEERYRVHDLVRRLIRERSRDDEAADSGPQDRELVRKADEVLETYHRSRVDSGLPASIADAIYHAYQLDPGRAALEWLELLQGDRPRADYAFGEALLAIRDDISPCDPVLRGKLARAVGSHLRFLARYEEAEGELHAGVDAFDEALRRGPGHPEVYNNKGVALMSLGEIQTILARHSEAEESFTLAIAASEEAIRRAPNYVGAHNTKGLALVGLGDIQAALSRHGEAEKFLTLAVAAYDEALRCSPEEFRVNSNKGLALWHLADIQVELSRYGEAEESYTLAIAACDEALRRMPGYTLAHNNKGIALFRLGHLQAALARDDDAEESHTRAIAAYDEVLRLGPDDVEAHNNKGIALQYLGELQASLSRHSEAEKSHILAIAAYGEVLRRAPDYVLAYNNKGIALRSLGDLQASLARYDEAEESYTLAIAACREALWRVPNYVFARNDEGVALRSLGDLQAGLARYGEAKKSYARAIAAFNRALRRVPSAIFAINNKGDAFRSFGDLQAGLARHNEAEKLYARALAAFGEILHRAPGTVFAHNNMGDVLARLGDLEAGLAREDRAEELYTRAIAAYDEALRRAPNTVLAHRNRGDAFRSLGDLQASLLRHEEAAKSYTLALAALDEALRRAPHDVVALSSRGNLRRSLGNLKASLSRHLEAQESYDHAIAVYDEALRHAPDSVAVHKNKGIALVSLGDLQARPSRADDARKRYAEAVAAYDQALRRAPGDLEALKKKRIAVQRLADL